MATAQVAPAAKAFGWLKNLGLLAALVIGVAIIVKMIGGFSFGSSSSGEDWKPVAQATCQPVWNDRGGWCDIGEVTRGTYRVVPKFEVWQMKLTPSSPPKTTDKEFLPVPPKGIAIETYLDKESQVRFINGAQVKSRLYGALIIRAEGKDFEALSGGSEPREFVVTSTTRVSINVNLPPLPANYAGNVGELTVELERRAE
ncbi:MAG: hypothetical protein Q8O53_01000 [Candidatus Moranbacteria bacterium]|nr:hypothetical protein [Candidatus Moranbacteria bacterium]